MASVTALTTSSALGLVQEIFSKSVHDGTRTGTFFFNTVKTANDFSLAGKHAVFSINFQRSTGFSAIPPTGANWPAAGTPNPQQFMVGRAFCAGTIKWEEQADMVTSADVGSFASARALDLETFMTHMDEEMERQALSNGSGILNILGGLSRLDSGTALVPTAAGWQAKVSIWDAIKIREGMMVEIWRVGTALNSTNWRNATRLDLPSQGFYTISNVTENASEDTATITFAEASPGTAPPVAAGVFGNASNFDYLVVAGTIRENVSSSTTNLGYEMNGLDGIACGSNGLSSSTAGAETGVQWLQLGAPGSHTFADDTFQNLSPITWSKWNANIVDATTYGGELSHALLSKATTYQSVFGTRPSTGWRMFIGHPATIDVYARTLANHERYTITGPTPAELPSGRISLHQNEGQGEQLKFAGVPFYGSPRCRADRVYGVNDEGVEKVFLEQFRFKTPRQSPTNEVAMEMNGIGAQNMFTRNRRSLLAIHNLSIPTST